MKRTAKSFPVYLDYAKAVNKLSDDEAGKLFKALLEYADSGQDPQLEGSLYAVFAIMQNQLDRDTEKYVQKCERLRQNGSKGGRPVRDKEPNGNQEKPNGYPEKPKKPDTDTDTVTDTVTDSNIGSKASKPPTSTSFDFQAVQELYNCYCPSLPRCAKLTEKRKKSIRSCIKEKFTMEDFEAAFKKAEASSFLTGNKPGSSFRACFDWLTNPSNLAKVLEGNYDDMEKKSNGKTEPKPLWTVGTTV